MEDRTERTAGKFTYKDGQVYGPKGYMEDPNGYAARMVKIQKGQDVVFNYPSGQDIVTTLLVALQTDYAGWKGARELQAQMGRD